MDSLVAPASASAPAAASEPPDDAVTAGRPVPAAASALAVTAFVLGAVAVALSATIIWFFVSLPLGIAAVTCGILERRRAAKAQLPARGIATAGLVLGGVGILMSFGGLFIVPKSEGAVRRLLDGIQGGVQKDLESVERDLDRNVDALDATLTRNVDVTTQALQQDFLQLEEGAAAQINQIEDRLEVIVSQLEAATGKDLDKIDSALTKDLAAIQETVRSQVATIEATVNGNVARIEATANANVARLEQSTSAQLAASLARIQSLEAQLAELNRTFTEVRREVRGG